MCVAQTCVRAHRCTGEDACTHGDTDICTDVKCAPGHTSLSTPTCATALRNSHGPWCTHVPVFASAALAASNMASSGKEAGGPSVAFRWVILCPSSQSLLLPLRHLTPGSNAPCTSDCGHVSKLLTCHRLAPPADSCWVSQACCPPGPWHRSLAWPELLPRHSPAVKGSPSGIAGSRLPAPDPGLAAQHQLVRAERFPGGRDNSDRE